MKKTLSLALAVTAALALSTVAFAGGTSGKALFDEHCNMCHRDGGNMMKPSMTLHSKDLKKNGRDSVKGIVGMIRKGGAGMPSFSKSKISDAQAKDIAKYILKAYK